MHAHQIGEAIVEALVGARADGHGYPASGQGFKILRIGLQQMNGQGFFVQNF